LLLLTVRDGHCADVWLMAIEQIPTTALTEFAGWSADGERGAVLDGVWVTIRRLWAGSNVPVRWLVIALRASGQGLSPAHGPRDRQGPGQINSAAERPEGCL
jgi:hypothetical protein